MQCLDFVEFIDNDRTRLSSKWPSKSPLDSRLHQDIYLPVPIPQHHIQILDIDIRYKYRKIDSTSTLSSTEHDRGNGGEGGVTTGGWICTRIRTSRGQGVRRGGEWEENRKENREGESPKDKMGSTVYRKAQDQQRGVVVYDNHGER